MDIYNLIASVLVIIGVGIIVKIFSILYFYKVTIKKWNKTEGKVLESEIIYFRSQTDADTEGWKHKVVYKYIVNHQEYIGNRISKNIGYLSPSKELSSGIEFSKGQIIDVYYNPEIPEKAVLDNKFNYISLFYITLSLIAFYIANLMWIGQIE